MAELGIADSTINGWTGEGYLAPLSLPGVYAVGHRAPSVEAELSEALLYAGAVPGAGCTSMAAATSRVPGIATCR